MDCKKCLPEILTENEDAEKIYLAVQDQLIVGMCGAVALNQLAIHAAMDLFDVEYRQDCFEKVVMLGRHFISQQKNERRK
jgi:hypothetical protein